MEGLEENQLSKMCVAADGRESKVLQSKVFSLMCTLSAFFWCQGGH